MQKRAYNAIRAISEEGVNPIISIHDHGAGGHLNCLSELVEATGGRIDMDKLPIGDPTLSAKEIVGNESQERMGLVVDEENIDKLRRIAERERSPFYVIGEATGDMQFTFVDNRTGEKPIDLKLEDMFGKAPRTVLERTGRYEERLSPNPLVRCRQSGTATSRTCCSWRRWPAKDWLTNKVDRSVTGQRGDAADGRQRYSLPLNDCAVVALDYQGHARHRHGARACGGRRDWPTRGRGSVLAITEALTNIVFAPIDGGLRVGLAERQLDVALQERGRGRAALRGRAGGERLCGGPGDQHSDRQGFAVDDAEVPRRRAGVRAGYGDHHLGGRGVGREEGGLSGARSTVRSQIDLRGHEPRRRSRLGGSSFCPGASAGVGIGSA